MQPHPDSPAAPAPPAAHRGVRTIAWISFFPVEWLPDAPEPIRRLPRQHPASWQRVLLAQLERRPDLRLHIIVLRKQFDQDLTFERNGVMFHLIRTRGGWRGPTLFWHDTLLVRRALRGIRPDLVHAWGTENGAGLVASRLGVPYLVTMQGLLSWLAGLVPFTWYDRLALRLEHLSLRRARFASAESRFAVGYLQKNYPRLSVRQIEHAPAGLYHDVQRRPQLAPFRFLSVGSLSVNKGTDLLMQALNRMRDIPFELIVVGRGALSPEAIRAMVSPEVASRFRFRDLLTAEEIAAEMVTATLMIYPTRADNSPNAVKEAAVAGVPVVASRIGGIPDYVFPDANGLLFPAGDVPALEASLRAALAHPLFSRGQVAPEALGRVRAYLSAGEMGRKFVDAYDAVLSAPER